MIEDDFREDQKKLEEFGVSLPEFFSFKFRSIYQIFNKYENRIDELRSEADYSKAQIERRANTEKALAFRCNDLEHQLAILKENRWVRLLKWLRVI